MDHLPSPEDEQAAFERDVRRIAEQLWPMSNGGSALEGGRERDGVYRDRDLICCLEATVSIYQKKAEKDLEKLASLLGKFLREHPERQSRAFWIVRHPPNKAQFETRDLVLSRHPTLRRSDLVIETLDQFRRRLFSPEEYVERRNLGVFGSVADPATGSTRYEAEYVPLDLAEVATGVTLSIREVASAALDGGRFLLLGDYGAGKSMTLREVFRRARAPALRGDRHDFPVHLNLREHHGQTNPAEALIRHATSTNVPPAQLLSAWRAGFTTLLLDGFDELGTGRAIGSAKRVREARREAVSLIRAFVAESPSSCGMVIAGRSFYFDDASERDSCLGTTHGFRILTLNEFTDEQVAKYLARNHIAGQLPRWLPSRPLLLGYLAASGLLAKELTASALDQADRAWDDLLDKICKREADQQRGMYASEIREVLERLASRSRVGEEGIGPIEHELLWQVFEEVAGRKPDERDIVQLNRLPGLGIPPAVESESLSSSGRYFIDTDFADAARAGDVFRVVTEGRTFTQRVHLDAARWKHSLDELGVAVAAFKLSGLTKAKEIAHSAEMAADSQYFHLTWDLLRIAATNGQPVALSPISITGTDFGEVDIESLGTDLSHIEFRSCEIDRLIRGDLHAKHHPVFHGCVIETVIGPPLSPDEKERLFPQCELGTFQRLEMTTSSILELPAPAGTRVLLTILKKLYQQRGRGRKQSAFVRGLELDARKLVPEALRLVASFGLGTSVSGHSGPVWFPNRSARSRVGQILASPVDSTDPIVLESHRIA